MKIPKPIFMAAISILLLTVCSQGVFADTANTATSTATVKFGQPATGVGLLTLDHVPDLNFGNKTPSIDPHVYTASSDALVRVIDRGSGATGWNVSVKAASFTGGSDTLEGAQIYLSSGSIQQVLPLVSSTLGNPTVPASIVIDTDGTTSSPVASASGTVVDEVPQTLGMGSWEASWVQSNISLHVGGATMIPSTTYTSTLSWTLEDAPQS